MDMTLQEFMELFEKRNTLLKSPMANITVYDDGTGEMEQVKNSEGWIFENLNSLISKLQEDIKNAS